MPEYTSSALPVPVEGTSEEGQKGKRFSFRDRIFMGLLLVYHVMTAYEIAAMFGCTPQYVRTLGVLVEEFFNSMPENVCKYVKVTVFFLEKVAITLSVVCQASLEDDSRSIEYIFGPSCSMSTKTVSRIRHKYALCAASFNRPINLSGVVVTCSDEIFARQIPVLASIDPYSTMILCISRASDRTAKTWQDFMQTLHLERGLNLKQSVSDGGSGLLKGIKDAFPDCFIQKDLFHNLRELGAPIYALERSDLSYLKDYYDTVRRLDKSRLQERTFQKAHDMEESMDFVLTRVDNLSILYAWVKEILGFTHYSKQETM